MVKVLVVMLLATACVAEDAAPPPVVTILPDDTKGDGDPAAAAICAAAADLPASDPCSLVCDADAFKQRLIDDGMTGGACYQLRCELRADMTVTVGVCLP